MRCLLAEGDADFERCQAGIDGGAIYTSASIAFGVGGPGKRARTAISSNSASGNGGGVMAFSSVAELQVNSVYFARNALRRAAEIMPRLFASWHFIFLLSISRASYRSSRGTACCSRTIGPR